MSLDTALMHDNKTFEGIIYTEKVVKGREFQSCVFKKCDLSNTDLSHNKFLECTFEDCNLSMVALGGATLNDAVFVNCKCWALILVIALAFYLV